MAALLCGASEEVADGRLYAAVSSSGPRTGDSKHKEPRRAAASGFRLTAATVR